MSIRLRNLVLFKSYLLIHDVLDYENVQQITAKAKTRPQSLADLARLSHNSILTQTKSGHSVGRRNFCRAVAVRSREIAYNCMGDETFCRCFDNTHVSDIRAALSETECLSTRGLHKAASKLAAFLSSFSRDSPNDPLFTMVFDEVHGLIERTQRTGLVTALNRIMSVISGHKIWYLFLSTKSVLEELLPLEHEPQDEEPLSDRPSWRGQQKLQIFPPFTEFVVDITDNETGFVLHPEREHMEQFSTSNHMAIFGRPLWSAYDESSDRLDYIAKVKLLGGNVDKPYMYQSRDHVLAVLSARLCIDLNLANPNTHALAKNAVNLHMRRLDSLNVSTGVMFTRAPVEPILGKAAMQILLESPVNWHASLRTFTSQLLERSAVEKGPKGELFSRLLLTLAHDTLIMHRVGPKSKSPNQGSLIFTVHDFLKALYSESHHEALSHIDVDILTAQMNFLGFASTQEHLDRENGYLPATSFQYLCYTLLRRSMAIQLAPQQNIYDQILPFYRGDLKKPFDVTKVGAILVQIKYRQQTISPSDVFNEDFFSPDAKTESRPSRQTFKDVIVNDPKSKLLFILLDFGSEQGSVDVTYSKASNPTIWAIHSKGQGEDVFGCIGKMGVQQCVETFFTVMKSRSKGDITFEHDKDLLGNVLHHDKIQFIPEADCG